MHPVEKPLVSIIVPVYKVEKQLNRCIDSIINQSYNNIEIILVDDGSPDNCPVICDQYADNDVRVVVVHKVNGGLSSARNSGLKIAKGSFVTFVDSDDYILSDMIEQLVYTALDSKCLISICRFTDDIKKLQDSIISEYSLYSSEDAIKEILQDGRFGTTACAKLYDINLFEHIAFPEGMLYEDFGTVYKLLYQAGKVSFVDIAKYFYTFNDSGITKSAFSSKQMDYFIISDEVESFVKTSFPKLLKYVRSRSTDMAISLYLRISVLESNNHFESEKNKLVSIIRSNIFKYIIYQYPVSKKCAAIVISIAPRLAEQILKKMNTN